MNLLPSLATSLGLTLVQKWWERRKAAEAANTLPPAPEFTPTQLAQFTRVEGQFRAFSHDTAGVTLAMLGSRSAQPVQHPQLSQYGRAWRVVPLQAGLPRALDLVLQGFADPNAAVVGSLSMVLLPNGSTLPMVIVIGPAAVQMLAVREGVLAQPDGTKPGGAFALLRPPPLPAEATAPAPAPETAAPPPEPVTVTAPADVPVKKNGKATAPRIEPAIVAEHTVTSEK